ncbi:MAG: mitochondrial fission ELM1 family protein [Luteimonas sp.]|nr:mitochondrial fission ELM1 family protein [Luteimonas sp.]
MNSQQTCSVSDGRAGNARQAGALAAELAGGSPVACTLQPRAPWRWLAPRRLPGAASAFGDDFVRLLDASPGLAVGCGRQAALATRLLRARGSKVVQILDPRLDPTHWNLVVAPMHDGLSGANVITTLGSLHPVDDAWLARARARFAAFEALPRPRTALLLGGGSAHARFDLAAFDALASGLDAALARDGGSVLATASRRTPADVRRALHDRYRNAPGFAWRDEADGPNPYPGLLAWADRIVCSPDSVNMISEACATHAPVFVFEPGRVRGRPQRFLDALLDSSRISAMDAALAPFAVQPMRDTARVAAEIRRRLA